jgi:dipeptidyl aminopeptidase/acylaminoacyl peptidase
MKHRQIALALVLCLSATAADIKIRSSKDGTEQPALLEIPEAGHARAKIPLVVHLHSWSSDYKNSSLMDEVQKASRDRGWVFLSPNFRGPNDHPEACGSNLAVSDVMDAIHYAESVTRIDADRIYLVGGSGGGYMALLLAARYPKMWAAVSAWVPISDLTAWHASTKEAGLRYDRMMEKCFGGAPANAASEYRRRSPLFNLDRAKGLPISIHTGIHDGHNGSVPVSQSLRAFNVLAKANGHAEQMFSEEEIRKITVEERIPPRLQNEKRVHSESGKFATLYSRTAGPVILTIFEGGHATDFPTAMNWLARQGPRRP